MGFRCLFVAILITVAEIIVLVMSNGKPVSKWTVKEKTVAPNVILSVLNSVCKILASCPREVELTGAGVCFAIAVTQGIAISW